MVALVYTGEVHLLEFPAPYSDPAKTYADKVEDGGAEMRVGTVRGAPALIIEPKTDQLEQNPAWVEFDEQNITFVLSSDSLGTVELQRTAESLTS